MNKWMRPVVGPVPLIDRLHALRESLFGSEHDEKRRTIEDAIKRINSLSYAKAALASIVDNSSMQFESVTTAVPSWALATGAHALATARALVREQDGGEK